MIKLSKKAITALMITVLLVSGAVAVGAVVMKSGSAQVEESAGCATTVGLKISKIGGKDQVCTDGKKLTFTVENGVNIKVDGLLVNAIGAQAAASGELNKIELGKAGVYKGSIDYDTAAKGAVQQVKIIPKVVPYDAEIICTEQALVVESVGAC